MSDSTTPAKGLTQPQIGISTSWANLLNADLGLIDSALGGTTTIAISGSITLNATQNTGYEFTGTLTAPATIIWPSGSGGAGFNGLAVIQNNTSGGFSIICGYASGGTVSVVNGASVTIWSDGTNFYPTSVAMGIDGSPITLLDNGALIDTASWDVSNVRLSTNLNNTSMTDMDQFGLMIQAQITGNTSSSINYERGAALLWARTADPSGSTTRDCVGLDTRGFGATGNMTSRIWGSVHTFEIETGADGLATGIEIDCVNYASADQAQPDTTTSKYGIAMYADGNTPTTVGLFLSRGNPSNYFHKGILATGGTGGLIGTGSSDRFIELDNNFGGPSLFDVDAFGNTNAASYSIGTAVALSASDGVLHIGAGFSGGNIEIDHTLFANSNGLSVTGIWNPNYSFDCEGAFARFTYNTATLPASDDAEGGWVFAWNRSQNDAENVAYNIFDNGGGFDFRQKTGSATSQSVFAVSGTGALTLAGSAAFTANGSVATSLGSVGPTGAHSTVQKWFTVSDGTNTYYIPAF